MAKEILTRIEINASPQTVWQILTDFPDYPNRNLFIKKITGSPQKGQKIRVEFEKMVFNPKVLVWEPEKEFRWKGHLGIKGLFDGEHSFIIEDKQNGTVSFIHAEKFTGILVPLFKKMIDTETLAGFESFNRALKERAEEFIGI